MTVDHRRPPALLAALRQPFDYRWLDTPALAPIRRDFLPDDLEPLLAATGSTGRSSCRRSTTSRRTAGPSAWPSRSRSSPASSAGSTWRARTARSNSLKFAAASEVRRRPARHAGRARRRFHRSPRRVRGLKVLEKHGVPFDLLFYVKHLRHAADAGAAAARPADGDRPPGQAADQGARTDDWLPDFRAAAACPQCLCKLSGMVTEADWHALDAADLRPYVGAALDAFGPERLMFGSDWPVCELAASYAEVREALVDALGPISESERAEILGGTAARFYGLKV